MFFIVDSLKNGDCHVESYVYFDDAIDYATYYWDHLAKYDQDRRSAFFVCFCPSDDGCINFDHPRFKVYYDCIERVF